MASVLVDSLDVLGAILCYAQGTLDAESMVWTAVGAAFAAGWGGLCLSKV